MSSIWITFIVLVVVNGGINAGVVVRRRPISVQERIPHTSTPSTTTTTTTYEPEEESTEINHRLSRLTLPSNATSIRSDITDNFSCAGRPYGYYADVENDCQIFHVCLPVTYPDGQGRQFRWSFICPEETTFNQEAFTCVRTDEMNFDCTDSEKFYELNRILGLKEETTTEEITSNELTPISTVENTKARPGALALNESSNKETNQRFKPIYNNPNRISTPSVNNRNQIPKKTTQMNALTSAANTERAPQTTNFREFSSISDRNSLLTTTTHDLIPSTTFPPVNIAQFFDLTTRKTFNYPTTTTTLNGNSDYSTDFDQSTRTSFVPDLYENNDQSKKADEVVESIKQLQKLFPSNADDSREKRFLFKSDSVKNRQKLFDMLNHH